MTIVEQLAAWLVEQRGDAAREAMAPGTAAHDRALDAIRDTVGCMVAGAGDEGAYSVRKTALGYGRGDCTVFGELDKALAPFAALANGMSAHVLDYDDNYTPGITHASAVLVPALFAVAEHEGASGEALIRAYICGLEMHAALGQGIGREHYDIGWHNTSTVGCVGTAAACAWLLGLDADGIAHAMSLAISQASGAKVQFGSAGKPFHAGMAAHNAVLACELARNGLRGRLEAIEGERGLSALYAGRPDPDWNAIIGALGKPLAIEEFGLSPKLYPCCGSAHKALDGVLALRAEHGFSASDVAEVDTLVGYGNKRNLCYPDPQQEMEARFSMQYCVAVALLNGKLSLADFTPTAVHRPAVRAVLPLIKMRAHEPGAEGDDTTKRLPHEVTVKLKDGRELHCSVTQARGAISNPFDEADKQAKFTDCCAKFLTSDDFGRLDSALGKLHELDSLKDLTRHAIFSAGCDHGERFGAVPVAALSAASD